MTFRAPVTKPYGVAPSPYMAQGAAKGLWKGLAFIAPLQTPKGAGTSTLLDQFGHPLAGSNLTAGSTLQWRGTPYGLGVGISGVSYVFNQTSFEPIKTSDGAGTGDYAYVMLANPISEARRSSGMSQNASSPRTELFFNCNDSGASSAGGLAIIDSTGSNFPSVTGVIDGKYHMFGYSRRGKNRKIFVDGVEKYSASPAIADVYGGSGSLTIGGRSNTADLINTATDIVFVAGWNRALSNFEMLLLGIDPFYMFRPAPRQKIINTVAAGGTAVPVFMHHYMQQRAA